MDEQLIRQVLQGLGVQKIKRSGGSIMASCPLAQYTHAGGQDKNPSFSMKVNPGGESPWKCFSCNNKGTMKGLIYKYKEFGGGWRQDLWDLIKGDTDDSLGSRLGKLGSWGEKKRKAVAGPEAGQDWVVDGYEATFDLDNYKDILADIPKYALDRGITIDQAIKWNLGFDKKEGRLFIPLFSEENKLVGFSGRAIYPGQSPKYKHAEYMRRDKYLYGEHLINKSSRTGFIVEGFMDVWALERYGLDNCLGTMGTACSAMHIAKLVKWFDKVVIFPHNDERDEVGRSPGQDMADAYELALKEKGVRVFQAPVIKDKKDPGEWSADDFMWVLDKTKKMMEV